MVDNHVYDVIWNTLLLQEGLMCLVSQCDPKTLVSASIRRFSFRKTCSMSAMCYNPCKRLPSSTFNRKTEDHYCASFRYNRKENIGYCGVFIIKDFKQEVYLCMTLLINKEVTGYVEIESKLPESDNVEMCTLYR
ncbi:hypothetical protein AVEN_53374-1 [Araneus ventricosus]|uniref:Uncharacterized protein n=1 Tax=Araneus ventricosus TaxID=182803 RepID=A0A4Y2ABN3_ARAVE|nr:hypothetical protein AVEN_53374-1 [Araneus ventricosus]